jgi:hypothetical protein
MGSDTSQHQADADSIGDLVRYRRELKWATALIGSSVSGRMLRALRMNRMLPSPSSRHVTSNQIISRPFVPLRSHVFGES